MLKGFGAMPGMGIPIGPGAPMGIPPIGIGAPIVGGLMLPAKPI